MAAKLLGDYPPPALSHTQELLQELTAAQGAAAGEEWAAFSAAISAALQREGADGFLRLAPIAKTVHSRQRSLAPRYLAYLLRSAHFTPALQKALTESPVGQPLVNPYYPWSSPLLVQHGYHVVRLLEATDFDLARIRLVTDFGGGYGSFCRLLRNLGYRQRYLICDLPVMCALQRFYLRNVFPSGADGQPPQNVQWLSTELQATLRRETVQASPALFVATWSLSESPLAVRNEVAPALPGYAYVLCAYQRTFGSYDNHAYFTALARSLPQFEWRHAECPVYPNNFYLIGRNGAAG
ncbi:MAG TPA: putative sugar O-methyltransferase [Steroidobacteraceae bacterium]|nr:putative sugar O-methyltransferase [Steroidobacteraceae bacterium]